MIYFVLFLLLLGGWQAFMRGSKSDVISGTSLWLALILLIVGLVIGKIEMNVVLFALFVLTSIFILMQIYQFSTYHKYFSKMVPVLLGYGVLIGYLLFVFNFSNYFISRRRILQPFKAGDECDIYFVRLALTISNLIPL